jgi:hypothetical protein
MRMVRLILGECGILRTPWHSNILGDPNNSVIGKEFALLLDVLWAGRSCNQSGRSDGENSDRAHVETDVRWNVGVERKRLKRKEELGFLLIVYATFPERVDGRPGVPEMSVIVPSTKGVTEGAKRGTEESCGGEVDM